MSRPALRELGDRWRAVDSSLKSDQAGLFTAFRVAQSAGAQTKQRDKAVIALVDSLQPLRPDLYSQRALRKRCLSGCGHIIVSLAFGAILAFWTDADVPTIGDAALVLFRSHLGIS